jgi:hypothetical protein
MPDVAPTDAIVVLLLVQIPPDGVQLKVELEPVHTAAKPVMELAPKLTVTVTVE